MTAWYYRVLAAASLLIPILIWQCVRNDIIEVQRGEAFTVRGKATILDSGCATKANSPSNQGSNTTATKSNQKTQKETEKNDKKKVSPVAELPVQVKEKLDLAAFASKHSVKCYEAESDWDKDTILSTPADTGILYAKPYKTGSSTCAGITIRMARNQARRDGAESQICRSRFDHGPWKRPAYTLHRGRDPARSFLWTNVREPTKRIISLFFFGEVSRHKKEPTDTNFQRFLTSEGHAYNYYLEALSLGDYKRGEQVSEDSRLATINSILSDYDFVGVTERLDESAVALAMLRGIPLSDVLYVSAKTHPGYDDGGTGKGCTYMVPSFVSPGMEAYFDSEDWKSKVKYDDIMYKAANIKLDNTIKALGRERFEKNLQAFVATMDLVKKECHPVLPCNSDGKELQRKDTDCLWLDSGCSLECLDKMASRTGIDKVTY